MSFRLNMFFVLAVVALPYEAMSADSLPPELRGAADMRGQVEAVMGSATSGRGLGVGMAPAATPEEEMARRRKLINGAHRDFVGAVAAQRAPVGMEGVRASQGSESGVAGALDDPRSPEGEASARDPGTGFDGEKSSSTRVTLGPPRAIAIEGRVTVQGGEGQATAQTKGSKEIFYSVEERFVGNLLIAEPMGLLVTNPSGLVDSDGSASARGGQLEAASAGRRVDMRPLSDPGTPVGGRKPGRLAPGDASGDGSATGPANEQPVRCEYELDTVSTAIQVKSVQGGVCVETTSGGGACARRDPFSSFEVDSANRYGQFRDGVVSVAVEDGKVKIEVEAPDVAFATASGKGKAALECSRADFELSENEFRRLLDRGELTLTRQVGDSGRHAKCAEGSSITVDLRLKRD
ncbi:MAG: hypothetical protein WCA83_08610 [Azonexus sp.]